MQVRTLWRAFITQLELWVTSNVMNSDVQSSHYDIVLMDPGIR